MIARHLLCGLLALSTPLLAQTEPPKRELTEKTLGEMDKLRAFMEGKDYAGGAQAAAALLARTTPGSYDQYVLSQIQAQMLLQQGRLTDAIAPLETTLSLAEGNANFYDQAAYLEVLGLVSQLYYQRALEQKTPAAQKSGYEQALQALERWFERSPKGSADNRLLAASLLYQLGTLGSPDPARLRQAIVQAREGLLLSLKPSPQLYLLLVACHLQLDENAAAAEWLEILTTLDPKNAGTWTQLQSIYLALGGEAKDPRQAQAYNLRALHALDRAQGHGQLTSPKDHYTRVALLFNLQQHARAAALLEKGLADGTLENTKRNWELLASAYQQTGQEPRALDAMSRAVQRFPQDGALEYGLAQYLYGADQVAPAYERAQSALRKGLEKPEQARLYLAHLAYELQRYDEARRWAEEARAGGVPAQTIDPLSKAIAEALRART